MEKLLESIEIIEAEILSSKFTNITSEQAFSLINLPDYLKPKLWALASMLHKKTNDKCHCASFYLDTSPCSEDCAFCPFSKYHYSISISNSYTNEDEALKEILNFAQKIIEKGACNFKIVSTGAKVKQKHINTIEKAIRKVKEKYPDLTVCISLGLLNKNNLIRLKEAGADIYNNNLESDAVYFPKLVTTHNFEDKIKTIKLAKEIGYKICSGIIVGTGESKKNIIEAFKILQNLNVNSSPLNIYIEYSKSKLKKRIPPITDILDIISIYRLMLPNSRLILGAGTQEYFSSVIPIMKLIGANTYLVSGALSKKIDYE